MKEILKNFLNIIFPKSCLECGKKGGHYICSSCLLKSNLKYKIFKVKNKNYNYFIYLEKYKDEIRKKILKFKFYDEPYIGEYFLEILLNDNEICSFLKKFDIVIPVPMYQKKKLKRGYNQTEILSKILCNNLNLKCKTDILIKFRENKTQSLLSEAERFDNVKDVFKIDNEKEVFGKNIILVDDIVTTGATILACASLLKNAGAREICVLVIAKT